MKRVSAVGLMALWASAAPVGAASPGSTAERFAWLPGCWGGQTGATAFLETWTVASPDLLLATSSTATPGKPIEFEFLRIETRPGGAAYVAQPGGVAPTDFLLSAAESAADNAVFVNLKHDFPKRIAYRRVDAQNLLAWIDGGAAGSPRIEFPMRRVACPGAAR